MRRFLFFILILSSSCLLRRNKEIPLSPQRYFELGLYYYFKGKYEKAREYFNKVLFSGEITEMTDDAQFYIAKSYLMEKNYETALSEFNFLITQFPNSEHVEEAEFRIAEIYMLKIKSVEHETEDLKEALDKIEDFLRKYPESEFIEEAKAMKNEVRNLLAEKIFRIGELYENLGKFESAKIYFEEVIKEYPDTYWAELAENKINKDKR